MSFNLIDLIKEPLTDQIMGQLGNVLGGSTEQNSSAISSAIPGILSGLLNAGKSNPQVANSFVDTLKDHDDSFLDNLGDLLGDSKQSSTMMDFGTKALGSLLGGGGVGSLVSAISGFSGAGKGPTKSLLGLLAPIIFGVIKRKLLGSGGLSVGNLLNMFTSQEKNINASMPAGFDKQLKSSGFFDNFVSNAVPNATETAREVKQTAPPQKSFLGKLVPLAIIVGGLLFAYNYFMKGKTTDVAPTTSSTVQTADPVQELKGVFGSLTSSLGSITDAKSAQAVLPSLTESTNKLGNLAGMLSKLPEAQRSSVISTASSAIPQLRAIIDKVGAIPGVGDIIKPAIEALVGKLALFK